MKTKDTDTDTIKHLREKSDLRKKENHLRMKENYLREEVKLKQQQSKHSKYNDVCYCLVLVRH